MKSRLQSLTILLFLSGVMMFGCRTAVSESWSFSAGPTMVDETVLFSKGAEPPAARLLFTPTKVLSVEAANESAVYTEGKDYTVDLEQGLLVLTDASAIKSYTLYGDVISHGGWKDRQGRNILWGEGDLMHSLQVKVTYTHSGKAWAGAAFLPTPQPESLPLTTAKLRDGKPCSIVLCGDSITEGYNASGFVKAPPHQPAYGELVIAALREQTDSDIAYNKIARAGAGVGWGHGQLAALNSHNPDLAIIAFGMNDAGARGDHAARADNYKKRISAMIEGLRKHNPKVELVLVANMLPNTEFKPHEGHYENRDRLLQLAREYEGVVVADVMAVTEEILKRKSFADISGNHLNHPNDWLHRLYAEVILRVLGW